MPLILVLDGYRCTKRDASCKHEIHVVAAPSWWGVCKTIPYSVLTTLAFGLSNGGQETSILDIGALHAGQFFGEVSFLFDVYKSMSSMCFLPLSEFFHYFMIIWVSVLQKWWCLAEHLEGFIRLQTLVSLGFCSLVQFKIPWWPIVIEHILCALILWTSKSCFGNVERPSDRINKGSQHCCGNLGWDFGAQQVGLLPPLWPWCHWGPFKKCDLLKLSSSWKRRVWRGSWLYIHSNFPTKLCTTNHLCTAICLCVCVSYYQKWAREWTYSIAVPLCVSWWNKICFGFSHVCILIRSCGCVGLEKNRSTSSLKESTRSMRSHGNGNSSRFLCSLSSQNC